MDRSSGASSTVERRRESADAGVCLFTAEGQRYALDTAAVGEVTTAAAILPVPMAPPPVVGLFNLRGTPVAVVDLLVLLGSQASPAPPRREGTTLLVVRTDHPIAALRIDRLERVVPRDSGRRVLLEVPGVHPAQVGLFESPATRPAVPLLGAPRLVQALLALAFTEAEGGRPSA